MSACVLLVALLMWTFVPEMSPSRTCVLSIRETLNFYGPILTVSFWRWPGSDRVVVVMVGGGLKPPLRELSPVLPRYVRPCGELRILVPRRAA